MEVSQREAGPQFEGNHNSNFMAFGDKASQQKLQMNTKIAKDELKQIHISQVVASKAKSELLSDSNVENTLFNQCLQAEKQGRYLEGHSLFTSFVSKYPKSDKIGLVLRHLAQVEFNLAMYGESANTLLQLISSNVCPFPLHEILTDISRCFRMAGRIQEELEYLEKALETFVESSITVKIMYRIRNCYQKMCYLNPEIPYIAQFLSLYQLVVQDENGYLVLKPEYLEQLGTLYEVNLKLECAFTCYKLYINSSSDNTNWITWYKMGSLCMRLNRLHDGVKAFRQAVKNNTSSWESFVALAEAYDTIGEIRESLAMYKHAYALNPLPNIAESIDVLSRRETELPTKKQKLEVQEMENFDAIDYSNYDYNGFNMQQQQQNQNQNQNQFNCSSNSTLMVHFPSSDDCETSPVIDHFSLSESTLNIDSDKNSPELTQKFISNSPNLNPFEIQPIPPQRSISFRIPKTFSPPVIECASIEEKSVEQCKNACFTEPITLIKKSTQATGFDLSKFYSSFLVQQVPDISVEGRTQFYQESDENIENGVHTWNCTSKVRSMKLQSYVKYQNQFVDPKSSDDRKDKLKKGKSLIDFGTNIDMSDEKRWEPQLNEIKKLPQFMTLGSNEDMMTYYGFPVLGMNRAQLYMKVPGCRTPCHQENNNFCSININIGPDVCEWFAVDHKYWTQVETLCIRKRVEFLKGSWWPSLSELDEAGIPVIRFKQNAGDIVFVNSGTLHWVQSLGVCNNVAWNIGPLTANQYRLALERYYFNLKDDFKSIVPMETLSWKLAQTIHPQPDLFYSIRSFLVDSLSNQKDMENRLKRKKISVVDFPAETSPAFYCCKCYKELFNYIFIRDGPTDREKSTYCETCWFTKIKSRRVISCRRKTIEELTSILDNFEKLDPTL